MEIPSSSALLVAFGSGFASCAEPIVCGDLTGPYSLFGSASGLPHPVRAWEEGRTLMQTAKARREPLVLWEESHAQADDRFAVPAATYITGVCTSTFDIAWQLIHNDLLPPWGAVIASAQTVGRGQFRRPWQSLRGNMLVSFRLPAHPVFSAVSSAVSVGYMLCLALRRMGYTLSLKWPNDLLRYDGKKVGGILLEERDGIVVAGVGINIAESPDAQAIKATSGVIAGLLIPDDEVEEDEPTPPFFFWQSLVSGCILEYTDRIAGMTVAQLLADASSMLAWKGSRVYIMDDGEREQSGICCGLGPSGGLLIQPDAGECIEVVTGSVYCESPVNNT